MTAERSNNALRLGEISNGAGIFEMEKVAGSEIYVELDEETPPGELRPCIRRMGLSPLLGSPECAICV
jgi:hypothetical protein